MTVEGVVPGLVIGVREGIEAALVIGIILGYLVKVGRRDLMRFVYAGTIAAFAASAAIAGFLFVLVGEFEGAVEQMFEGFTMILAVVVLTSMVFWMMKAAKDIKVHVQQRLEDVLSHGQVAGLVALTFLVVVREGIETALFVFGTGALVSAADVVTGVSLGLAIAGIIGVGLVRASWRINLRRFFQTTGAVLVVIAAGLFANGVQELQGAFGWTFGSALVYDLHAVLADDASNPLGYLLRGIVGYSQAPTMLSAAAYIGYWAFAILVYLGIRTGRIAIVSDPLRRAWRALVGPRRPTRADSG